MYLCQLRSQSICHITDPQARNYTINHIRLLQYSYLHIAITQLLRQTYISSLLASSTGFIQLILLMTKWNNQLLCNYQKTAQCYCMKERCHTPDKYWNNREGTRVQIYIIFPSNLSCFVKFSSHPFTQSIFNTITSR